MRAGPCLPRPRPQFVSFPILMKDKDAAEVGDTAFVLLFDIRAAQGGGRNVQMETRQDEDTRHRSRTQDKMAGLRHTDMH